MFTAARHQPPVRFLWRRLVRIAPLYWLATFVVVAFQLAFEAGISRLNLLKSLAFVPFANPTHAGAIWPILVPGWTLNYEMFFYLLFAIGLLSRHMVPFVTATIGLLVTAGFVFDPDGAIAHTYTNALMIEFLAGLWIGKLWAFDPQKFAPLWPLLPLGVVALPVCEWLHPPSILAGLIPGVAIVLGALAIEARGRVPRLAWAKLLGDASYSIYLVHTIAMMGVAFVVHALPIDGWLQLVAIVTLSVAVGTISGIGVYHWVEMPLLRVLIPKRSSQIDTVQQMQGRPDA